MRFIVFENLKQVKDTVTRLYPIQNMSYFQYDKVNKIFKIQFTDGTFHIITSDDFSNERMFKYFLDTIKDKVVFK